MVITNYLTNWSLTFYIRSGLREHTWYMSYPALWRMTYVIRPPSCCLKCHCWDLVGKLCQTFTLWRSHQALAVAVCRDFFQQNLLAIRAVPAQIEPPIMKHSSMPWNLLSTSRLLHSTPRLIRSAGTPESRRYVRIRQDKQDFIGLSCCMEARNLVDRWDCRSSHN